MCARAAGPPPDRAHRRPRASPNPSTRRRCRSRRSSPNPRCSTHSRSAGSHRPHRFSAVLPYALAGRGVIGCAETGTGKTYVLVADPGEADGARAQGIAQHHPRVDTRAHTRAGHPDRRRDSGICVSRAGRELVAVYGGVRWTAGALPASRRRHRRRHARLLDHMRSNAVTSQGRSVRARRSRPHDGHGLLARRPQDR